MLTLHEKEGTAIITAGIGYGKSRLDAFDRAELDANINAVNAVKFSSFIPPKWEISFDKEILDKNMCGRCLPMAYEYKSSATGLSAAAISVGVPKDKEKPCIVMEHTSSNLTAKELEKETEKSVREVFRFRKWALKKTLSKSVEILPKKNKFGCALVAVVYLPEKIYHANTRQRNKYPGGNNANRD